MRALLTAAVAAFLCSVAGLPPATAEARAPTGPAAHAAEDFHTRVSADLVTGAGVQLKLESFDLHEGNSLCPAKVVRPGTVSPGTKGHFCYEAKGVAGPGTYDTELSFKYKISVTDGTRLRDTGYVLAGHALVYYTPEDNMLACAIEKVNHAAPAEHLDCQLTTVRSATRSPDPAPTWKVTWSPTPRNLPKVYFIGDSVTAGFGYCGSEGGTHSSDIACVPNQPFANAWTGQNSLKACAPSSDVTPVNDRCSNNNDRGAPWNAGAWFPDPNAPSVAYPYVIAKQQHGALVYDWAMTGSTPADWDPAGGAFGRQLGTIKDSYVVMTLGANPLLAAYIKISLGGYNVIDPGECADTTLIRHVVDNQIVTSAAPLDGHLHGHFGGVLRCFDRLWSSLRQGTHLVNVYKTLIAHGNHVLALGYPITCPWTFGRWQPEPNPFDGPAKGYPCVDRRAPVWDGGGKTLSQWDQAVALGQDLNARIDAAVRSASSILNAADRIQMAVPDLAAWSGHQAWSHAPWIFRNDTWVHPSVEGHKQLAETVLAAVCRHFRHWCGSPPSW